jgi:hypothetical protein
MRDVRSVARSTRLRAEGGATAEEREVELRRSGLVSDWERIALEASAWVLARVAAGAAKGRG